MADWKITPDREPGSEPVTHAMQCARPECLEKSDASGGWEAPLSWALTHSGRNPSHTSYREIITRMYRTEMVP
ncbi:MULTISPECIES: hypothetical protein [Streptomyces]|uniref:DUF7848 domain-containing protein n=1 Tax=Streptomyces viridochromogenes TaxID=1938 RepID=A0A0L8JRI1_STRVR|nr:MULTISPECIES: hypothetical protein [Streptomyces]KOG16220.1 hypothetical protein ADK34_26150 [Streptomyces viridochromogenes]